MRRIFRVAFEMAAELQCPMLGWAVICRCLSDQEAPGAPLHPNDLGCHIRSLQACDYVDRMLHTFLLVGDQNATAYLLHTATACVFFPSLIRYGTVRMTTE